MTTWLITLIVLAIVAGLVWSARRKQPEKPLIPFGPTGNAALGLDTLEATYPLGIGELQSLNQENIESFNQDQIDQIYARLHAGPIPDGPYHGSFFFADGGNFRNIADVIGGLRGSAINLKLDVLTRLGELLWQGKVFYREQRVLRNIIDREQVVGALFGVSRDEMRVEEIFGDEVALLFPAKLYTGNSQFDPRRHRSSSIMPILHRSTAISRKSIASSARMA
jgi:hypothetical protein